MSTNSAGDVPAPAFTSTPGTTAAEGVTYTYQIETLPAAGTATLALVTAPSGATLNGNTITWTPSPAQSRVPNQFSVSAANAGGTTTMFWSVTPAGTVTGSLIETYWTSNGQVLVPLDWTKAPIPPRALVPQPDGSFQTLQGSGNSDGTFSIPNVPGGYYWLQPGPAASYWTSSSTFDLGVDFNGQPPGEPVSYTTTQVSVNFAGLDPLQAGDQVAFVGDINIATPAVSPAGATTFSAGALVESDIDFSQPRPAYFMQYEPESIGTLNALALGPAATLPNLALVNGAWNTVSATLAHSPQSSFDLNVKGSLWTPLFSNAGPSSATPLRADLELAAQASLTGTDGLAISGLSIPLLVNPQSTNPDFALFLALQSVCSSSGPVSSNSFNPAGPGEPPVTVDQDFGTVQYGDPFPATWSRVFTFCETASVPVPIPGSTTPITFQLVDKQSSTLPPSAIAPLIGQVQNPKINGTSLLAPSTVPATGITLSWNAPSGATPTGYKISTFVATTLTLPPLAMTPTPLPPAVPILEYSPSVSFYTAKTSASLPPLQAGQTYVFLITAILDGAANFESRPNRSALPTASVSVVSAPINVSSGP